MFDRPDVGNAMDARDDGRARGGVAGARRRSRGARHREHRETGEDFQTGLDVAALSRDKAALTRAVAPHPRRRAPLHRLAQPGVEAGHRRGQRQVRRRRAALRRRRRHRDRRERRHVPRPPRVDRAGDVVRGCRPVAQDRRSSRSCAWRWSGGTSACPRPARYQLGMVVADRRPARALARGGAGAGREDRPELAGGDARRPSGRCGARSEHGLTDACRAGAQELVGDVGPPRPGRKARWRSPRSARPAGPSTAEARTT